MGIKKERPVRWVEDDRRRLIEERCDRYEAEWRALHSPRIEDYLAGLEGEVRNALWLELVMLDGELRRGNREEPTLADYQGSCPGGMILLDPSTAELAPIAERIPEAGDRGVGLGLTQGAGRLGDLAGLAWPVARCGTILEPLEATEWVPGESTGPIRLPDTVGPMDGDPDLTLVVQPDSLAMARPGCTLGDYELLEKLGEGGMGIVFKARQKGLNRDVALKMINAGRLADDKQVRLFQIEAEAVAALDHPHIVPILGNGKHLGVLYYTMKLIDGRNLAVSLDRFRDQPAAIARLMVRVAEAIHHAHQRGVLHRDLKPSNILVDERGEPHVIDFGLAKRLGEGVSGESMSSSHPMGTPTFMSPEQAGGHPSGITTATDVYGMGTILYTLLVGRPPFSGTSVEDVLHQIINREPPPPHARNSKADRDLETICLKCLRKEPRDRYASARDLADDLNRWIEGRPIVARPVSKVERALKWVRRRPEIAALSAAVVIVTILGLAGILWNWMAAIAARDEALRSEDYARHIAYAAEINLAERDWRDASLREVRRRLDETRPPPGKTDLRCFEWYYLDRLCNNSQGQTLAGHTDAVWSVAFSRDGRRIASASNDQTIKIWDAATGQLIRTLADGEVIEAVVFNPNGSQVASGGSKHVVTLWDVATGQPIRTFAGHTLSIFELAFSPDGKTLASSSSDGTVKLWDVVANAPSHSLADHRRGAAGEVAFSPDGKTLFSAGGDEPSIRVWDIATARLIRAMKGDGAGPRGSLALRPDGKVLASGARDGTITIWDVASGSPVRVFRDHLHNLDSVKRLAFSPDGKTLASTIFSRQAINLWDPAIGHLLGTIEGHTSSITDIAFSPDGVHLASSSYDFTVKLWDKRRSQEARSLRAKAPVLCAAFGPDGSYLASAGLDRIITLWDLADGQIVRTLMGHTAMVSSVAISRDERRAASGGDDRSVRVWDVATGNAIHVLDGHADAVREVTFSPDGKFLASASNDRTVKLWEVDTGRKVRSLEGHIGAVKAVAFSPDGKSVTSAGTDGFVISWDLPSGRRLRAIKAHDSAIFSMALSPDGRWLASGGAEPSIKIWDVATGKEVHVLMGHAMAINQLVFSPDCRRLVSVGNDRTVRIWDPVFGQEILVLRGHAGPVWDVAISPDATRVASASSDSTVRLWEANSVSGPLRKP
jgi:eukaryotic-like serine/threonine-protein kinase